MFSEMFCGLITKRAPLKKKWKWCYFTVWGPSAINLNSFLYLFYWLFFFLLVYCYLWYPWGMAAVSYMERLKSSFVWQQCFINFANPNQWQYATHEFNNNLCFSCLNLFFFFFFFLLDIRVIQTTTRIRLITITLA